MNTGALHLVSGQDERVLLGQVWRTATAWERLRGLFALPPLHSGQALLIEPCNSIHTLGMRYALDLAFIDRQGSIRKLVRHCRPWRFVMALNSHATLEMSAGEIARCGLQTGMRVRWQANQKESI
ncbi:MAG: DUF192 domain-containing protein [Pseudomonadota bacterium]